MNGTGDAGAVAGPAGQVIDGKAKAKVDGCIRRGVRGRVASRSVVPPGSKSSKRRGLEGGKRERE